MKKIIAFIFLIISLSAFGQKTDSVKTKITGKWAMTKHVLPTADESINQLIKSTKSFYEFKSDGSYTHTFSQIYDGKPYTIVTAGQWKIASDNKKISVFNSKFLPPHDKDGIAGDRNLIIVKLSTKEFVTNENYFDEAIPGTSYYKKQ